MKRAIFIFALLSIFINIAFAEEDVISEVIDIKLAKQVKNRKPIDVSDTFTNDIKKVYCWTKIKAYKVPTYVVHEWYYKNRKMASVKLNITSPLFRTWSSKRIIPSWTGNWEVIVKDENGNIIATKSFLIKEK